MPLVTIPFGDLAQILFDDAYGVDPRYAHEYSKTAPARKQKSQTRNCPSGEPCANTTKCERKGGCARTSAPALVPSEHAWAPRTDILESESEYTVVVELPGVGRSNINVSFENNVLSVNGRSAGSLSALPTTASASLVAEDTQRDIQKGSSVESASTNGDWENVAEKETDDVKVPAEEKLESTATPPVANEDSAAVNLEAPAPVAHKWHKHERARGPFHRAFEFPDGIDASKLAAKYEDGVLVVSLPKQSRSKTAFTIKIA